MSDPTLIPPIKPLEEPGHFLKEKADEFLRNWERNEQRRHLQEKQRERLNGYDGLMNGRTTIEAMEAREKLNRQEQVSSDKKADGALVINGIAFSREGDGDVIKIERRTIDPETGIETTQTYHMGGSKAQSDKLWAQLTDLEKQQNSSDTERSEIRKKLDGILPQDASTDPLIYGKQPLLEAIPVEKFPREIIPDSPWNFTPPVLPNLPEFLVPQPDKPKEPSLKLEPLPPAPKDFAMDEERVRSLVQQLAADGGKSAASHTIELPDQFRPGHTKLQAKASASVNL